jgi:antitoxin (DNA-binding transcriptional repressor) of toxin-antitoxin stability system
MADAEDVVVTDHGVAAYRISRIDRPADRLDALVRAGVVDPPTAQVPPRAATISAEVARELIDAFEESRTSRDY